MINQPVTIAIVDDHAIIRKAVNFRLSIAGYKVVTEADNGKIFLDQLSRGTIPDVCILDINMPIMDGFETLRRLKTQYPEIKVVFFSMNNDRIYKTKALEQGADGYVAKDAPMEELDGLLKKLAERPVMKVAV